MKKIKFIITNLILVLLLVIFTGNISYADRSDVEFNIVVDKTRYGEECNFLTFYGYTDWGHTVEKNEYYLNAIDGNIVVDVYAQGQKIYSFTYERTDDDNRLYAHTDPNYMSYAASINDRRLPIPNYDFFKSGQNITLKVKYSIWDESKEDTVRVLHYADGTTYEGPILANDFEIETELSTSTRQYHNILVYKRGTFENLDSDIEICDKYGTPCIILENRNDYLRDSDDITYCAQISDNSIMLRNGFFEQGEEICIKYDWDESKHEYTKECRVYAEASQEINALEFDINYYVEGVELILKNARFRDLVDMGWKEIEIIHTTDSNINGRFDLSRDGENEYISIFDNYVNSYISSVSHGTFIIKLYDSTGTISETYTVEAIGGLDIIADPLNGDLAIDGDKYYLDFYSTMETLRRINGGKPLTFMLKNGDDINGEEVLFSISSESDNWIYEEGITRAEVANIEDFFEYSVLSFHVVSEGQELVSRIISVSQVVTRENLDLKVLSKGTIDVYLKNGTAVDLTKLFEIFDVFNPVVELKYEGGTIALSKLRFGNTAQYNTTNSIYFNSIKNSFPPNIHDYDDGWELYMTEFKGVYQYMTVINEMKKDVPLYIELYDEDEPERKYRLDISGVYGTDFDSNDDAMARTLLGIGNIDGLLAEINENLDNVLTVENGVLLFDFDNAKRHLYFRVEKTGVYYIYPNVTEEFRSVNLLNSDPAYYIHIYLPHIMWNNNRLMLAKAGLLTGETKEGKPLGEYMRYNPIRDGTYSVGYADDYGEISYDLNANCYTLVAGQVYYLDYYSEYEIMQNSKNADGKCVVKFDEVLMIGDDVAVEIDDEDYTFLGGLGTQTAYCGMTEFGVGYILNEDYSLFESFTRLIAWFVRSLANGLNFLVQASLRAVSGEPIYTTVDMDSLIFNHYPDTSIAFFESNTGGEDPSTMIQMFKTGIEKWYGVFTGLAIAGYIIILLYIGIRILLNTGGSKQSEFKEMLTNWVLGLVILIFFPYVIRYAIEINNVFVGMVEDSKMDLLGMNSANSDMNMSDFKLPDENNTQEEVNWITAQMDENPYSPSDNSYMAYMARKAHSSGDLVDAVVYLIMVWQFVMLVLLYYRRVFTIAFLIGVFPIVTISYAIDKVADGKAQAFGLWTKEIMSNIFIQSIHAVIYVFVIGATYEGGSYNGDWLLSIIGVTFLFKGEEILKKIIGQGSGSTIKSLGETAKRTVGTVVAIKATSKAVADNVVGAKSHLGRAINARRAMEAERIKARNMDFFQDNAPAFSMPSGSELGDEYYDASMAGDADYTQLADDIQVVNNRDMMNDPERLNQALQNVLGNRGTTNAANQKLMGALNLSDDELNELAKLQEDTVDAWVNGDKSTTEKEQELRETIDKEIEARLKLIFPSSQARRDVMHRALYIGIRDGNPNGKHKARAVNRTEVGVEYAQAEGRRNQFFKPDKNVNPFAESAGDKELSDSAIQRKSSIISTYYNGNATAEEKKMAEYVAMLKDFSNTATTRNAHRYTARQLMEASNYVAAHENDSAQTRNMVMGTLGISGADVRAIMAEEIGRRYIKSHDEYTYNFREEYENGAGVDVKVKKGISETDKKKIISQIDRLLGTLLSPAEKSRILSEADRILSSKDRSTMIKDLESLLKTVRVDRKDVMLGAQTLITAYDQKRVERDVNEAVRLAMAEVKRQEASIGTSVYYEEIEQARAESDARKKQFFDHATVAGNGITKAFVADDTPSALSTNAKNTQGTVLRMYLGETHQTASDEQKRFAECIGILKDFKDLQHSNNTTANKYTPAQLMLAATFAASYEGKTDRTALAVKNLLGATGEEIKAVVADEIYRQYVVEEGRAIESLNIAVSHVPDISSPSGMREIVSGNVTDVAIYNAMQERNRQAQKRAAEPDTIEEKRHCSESAVQGQISAEDILRKEREHGYNKETFIDYIISERELQNDREIISVEDFARAQLDDLPVLDYSQITFEGLTQEEHNRMADALRAQYEEEAIRTGLTSLGVVLGGIAGAGLAIGLNDDGSAVSEGFVGATVGMGAGDYLAERAMGRPDKLIKKVKILNPYTGQVEEVDLRKEGVTRDVAWAGLLALGKDEVLSYDDPILADFSHHLDIQFLQNKQKAEKKREAEIRKSMYNEALGNRITNRTGVTLNVGGSSGSGGSSRGGSSSGGGSRGAGGSGSSSGGSGGSSGGSTGP